MANLTVMTRQGAVRGSQRGDVRIWKGIPYAAPPTGERRFKPPEPPEAWTGERDAGKFGAVAAQSRDPRLTLISGLTDKVTSGEDCLVLNVFAPLDGDPGPGQGVDAWPVVVWIHGGAFVMGSGSTPLYDGLGFAEQGVVVVTINYRLGIPGLLYLGDKAADYAAGNVLLLDQVAALRWVRDNIAGFGGDPAQVTVMGESAGAISIAHLLAMREARGLFHRAILQSGALPLRPVRAAEAPLADAVLTQLGLTAAQWRALVELPIDPLIAAQEQLGQRIGMGAFAPYVDGVTVPDDPLGVVAAGNAAGVPVLLGTNRDEWTLFEVMFGEVTVEPFKRRIPAALGDAFAPLLQAYQAARPEHAEARVWVDVIGDAVFGMPATRLAEAQAAHAPVFKYRFDWKSAAFGGRLGAAHALELPFVWNRLDLPVSQILLGDSLVHAQALATLIHHSWAAFIKTGDPNGAGLPLWPRYDGERRATMVLDRQCKAVDDPDGELRALWPDLRAAARFA